MNMKDNSIMRLILKTDLHVRILKYFSLYEGLDGNETLRKNMLEGFAYQLYEQISDTLVDQYHHAVDAKEIYGNNFTERLAMYEKLVEGTGYLERLWREYPLLERMLRVTLTDAVNLFRKICEDYKSDRDKLEERFQEQFGEMLSVHFALGDKHDGATVASVKFEQGLLIYKPKNLLCNELYDELLGLLERHQVTDFKYYKTYCASDHSWQEFVIHTPDLTMEGAQKYYYRAGVLLSLLFLLRSTDIHFENIIVSGEYPIIIDTETLVSACVDGKMKRFQGKHLNQSVLGTAMLPIYDGLYDINVSGLFHKEEASKTIYYYVLVEDEEKDFIYEKRAAETSEQKNMVYVDGKHVRLEEVKQSLLDGFEVGAKCLLHNLEEFCQIIRKDKYQDIKVRAILRGTQVYYTFLREAKRVEVLKDVSKYERIFNILLKGFEPSQFGYLRVEEEVENLKNYDIPLFYTRMNDVNLYSRNRLICKDYFEVTPLQNILDAVSFLDEKMIRYQKHLIELSLFTFQSKEEDINTYVEMLHQEKEDGAKEEEAVIRKKDTGYMDSLLKEYVYGLLDYELPLAENEVGSLFIASLKEDGLKIDPLGSGIYMGGGIIHLLYSYAKMKEDTVIAAYAKRLLIGVYNNYRSEKEGLDRILYGVYEGYGGIVYLAYNYARMYRDEEIKGIFRDVVHDILEYYADNDFDAALDADYINGIGGTVFLLGRIYDEGDVDEHLKERMRAFFEKYYTYLKEHYVHEIGVAHGLAGNCMILSSIYRAIQKEEVLEVIEELLEREDTLIRERIEEGTVGYTWCRGLSGILMSRCVIRENMEGAKGSEKLYADLLAKIEAYSLKEHMEQIEGISNICMCHGIAGNMDAMTIYSRNQRKMMPLNRKSRKALFHGVRYRSEDLEHYRWFKNSDYPFESFMLGKSGVFYSLLHCMDPERVLSVNGLEIYKQEKE